MRVNPFRLVTILIGLGALAPGLVFAAVEDIPITTQSNEARADFIAAQAALDRGDAAPANALLRQAVAKDPNFTYAWVNLGVVSFSTEEFADALKRAEAVAGGASEGERLLLKINQKFLDSDFTGQLALARQLVEKYPKSPRAWANLAGVQGGINQYVELRQSLQKAIELDPKFTPAYLAMANSYMFNEPRDLVQAEKYFRKTIELEPGQDNFYWSLGDVYRTTNRLEQAREYYQRANLLDPNDGTSPLKLGHVDSFLGRYDDARADYDRGIKNAPLANRPFNANYRAFSWVHAGDPQSAIRELEKLNAEVDSMGLPANQRTGAKAFTLTNAVTIALHHNRLDDAQRELGQLAAILRANAQSVGTQEFSNIQEANIAYLEGQLAARRSNYAEAQRLAKKNADLVAAQSNPRKMENYHDLMGLIALLQKKYPEAVKEYRQADIKNNIYMKYHLALALEASGQSDEARRLFKEVGEWNFNSVGFALVRKDALAKAG